MKLFAVISVACLLHVASSTEELYREINPSAKISNLNGIGKFSNILDNAVIGWDSKVGPFSEIMENVKIGKNSSIGLRCIIREDTTIGDNVQVGNFSYIGKNCKIANDVMLHLDASLGANIVLNENVTIVKASIEDGCIVDKNAKINSESILGVNSYIGSSAVVGSNVKIRNNAVIQKMTFIPNNTQVDENDVIIKTPTTFDLYLDSLPFERIPQSNVQRMMNFWGEFNNDMRHLMEKQLIRINKNCQNIKPIHFHEMTFIKSLYLIKFHGIEQYKMFRDQVNYQSELVDSRRWDILSKESHFVDNATRVILSDNLRDQMIRLLALELDAKRNQRVSGDTFCKMVNDIKFGERDIKCDQALLANI